MHGYHYRPMPHAWFPPFVPLLDAEAFSSYSQEPYTPNIAYPFENAIRLPSTVDASSSRGVEEVSEATLELSEDEAICTSDLGKNNESINDDVGETINDESEMLQIVPDVGGK